MSETPRKMELVVSVAGDAALAAALRAGADAVCLHLAARRRGRGFRPDNLVAAVEAAHQHGARAYLAFGDELAQRDLGQAARVLTQAQQSGIDAVRACDPALLALRESFAELPLHWVAAIVANSAETAAAAELGAARAVLAGTLAAAEITAVCRAAGVEIESAAPTTPVDVGIDELRVAGVAAIGVGVPVDRSTSPDLLSDSAVRPFTDADDTAWVERVVGLYRRALDGEPLDFAVLRPDVPPAAADDAAAEPPAELPQYDLQIDVSPRGVCCRCTCGAQTVEWVVPKTVVRREKKAVSIGQALARFEAAELQGHQLGLGTTNDPDFLLVPRAFNALVEKVCEVIRLANRPPRGELRMELPEEVRSILAKADPHPANRLSLGDPPDRVRLDVAAVERFLQAARPAEVIVEGVSTETLNRVLAACGDVPLIVALPPLLLEGELRGAQRLVEKCVRAGVAIEANSWGGWQLGKQAHARIEAGPGLGVLNSLAAHALAQRGFRGVTLSQQADRGQLEELTAHCRTACALTIFGRPPRHVSREQPTVDRHGPEVSTRREGGLWVVRPVEPFDLRNLQNARIAVRHLVVDLVGSPDAVGDWYDVPLPGWQRQRLKYE